VLNLVSKTPWENWSDWKYDGEPVPGLCSGTVEFKLVHLTLLSMTKVMEILGMI
jgi:hypothetical protein